MIIYIHPTCLHLNKSKLSVKELKSSNQTLNKYVEKLKQILFWDEVLTNCH